jgi:hypothetical protein
MFKLIIGAMHAVLELLDFVAAYMYEWPMRVVFAFSTSDFV